MGDGDVKGDEGEPIDGGRGDASGLHAGACAGDEGFICVGEADVWWRGYHQDIAM